jgi:polar amino acid transport system substrate-binding protein
MSVRCRIGVWATGLLAGIFFAVTAGLAAGPEKLLLTTQEWAPYHTAINDVPNGIAVRVIDCVLEKMQQPYSITFLPWTRAQDEVKTGRAHGFFVASQSDKRDEYARLSTPIAPQKWIWYLRKDSKRTPEAVSFKQTARVAATAGSNMANWLEENGFNIVSRPKMTEQLVEMLQREYVDAVLANELVFSKALRTLKLSNDMFYTYVQKDAPVGVYFSKAFLENYPGFLQRFNTAIPACIAQ